MSSQRISRRGALRGAATLAGAALGSRLLPGMLPAAHAQAVGEKSALLLIFLEGGYNALFSSADSFGTQYFGVTSTNTENLGSGVVIDKNTFGTMPTFAKQHMANIGVRHGISDHDTARFRDVHMDNRSYPLILANTLGGSASVKAANVGSSTLDGNHPAEGGVSLQTITDMQTTINALGGGVVDPKVPDRAIGAKMVDQANAMSSSAFAASPTSLTSLKDAYPSTAATLKEAPKPFSFSDLASAYGLGTSTRVSSQRSKFAAAELMIVAGANVVTMVDGGWDSHDDTNGSSVRNQMTNEIMPGLNTFLRRMVDPNGASATGKNVVVAIMGDFARSLPGSDHAPLLNATVIGKYVKTGTSGKVQVVNGRVTLPTGTPSINEYWAYLAAATKTPGTPFGNNPHNLIL